MNDTIIIYDQNKNKKGEYGCSFQSKVYFDGLDIDVEEGDLIERIVTDNKVERYTVINVKYSKGPSNHMNLTTLTVEKISKFMTNRPKVNTPHLNITIKDSTITGSNISGINNGAQSIQNINNEIDDFLKIIEEKNINNKEEIKKLIEEFKTTKDKNKLVNIFSILGNGSSIGSMIIALSNLIK